MSKHKEHSKQISARKVAANQQNAAKSTGPLDTRSTRYNALKHGLLGQGVTELDLPRKFEPLLVHLREELQPVGILEEECVHQIALLTIRIRRARLLEAEAFTAHLNPPKTVRHPGQFDFDDRALGWTTEVIDEGLPAHVSMDTIDQINRTIVRYESAAEHKLFRWLNQLERLQRLRRGENVPAPATIDVNVHQQGTALGSFGNSAP
jgi:hypothetical protein